MIGHKMFGHKMRLWVRGAAWLCLSLMFWTAAAESTHNHATQLESATCSICVAAHSASPVVSSVPATPVFAAIGVLREEDIIAKAQIRFADQGIRGPPAI
jgi:hypothetical protein